MVVIRWSYEKRKTTSWQKIAKKRRNCSKCWNEQKSYLGFSSEVIFDSIGYNTSHTTFTVDFEHICHFRGTSAATISVTTVTIWSAVTASSGPASFTTTVWPAVWSIEHCVVGHHIIIHSFWNNTLVVILRSSPISKSSYKNEIFEPIFEPNFQEKNWKCSWGQNYEQLWPFQLNSLH